MENEQEQPNKINFKNILIGVVIGAVLIGLGIVIFLLLQPKEGPTSPTKKATPSAKVSTPPAKKDETADWNVYTGAYYTFKYPSNWKIETGYTTDELRLVSPDLVAETGPLITIKAGTMIRLYPPGANRDLKDYLHENSTETTLGGKKAIRSDSNHYTTYFVVNNSKFYQIPRLFPEGKQSEYEDTFEKILSTFKFLD
jgi:hypothetical protein